MRILLLSTYDQAGGAEKVAYDLLRAYRFRGHEVRMLVRYRRTADSDVYEVDPYEGTSSWSGVCLTAERHVRSRAPFRGQYRLVDWLRRCAWMWRWIDYLRGVEDFNYPYAYHLIDSAGWRPDLIHAHNLHGDYFDLRALVELGRRLPVVWTLHDTWAFTGHCAYFLNCNRWQNGCGQCPDLLRPPAIRRDQTADNWQRKRQIYAASRLAVSSPSRWLMEHVEQSILQPQWARIIPNGIDLTVFKQGDRREARSVLGLPQNAFICTFVAHSGNRVHPYKDPITVREAVQAVAEEELGNRMLFVCIGGERPSNPDPRYHYTGYISDIQRLVRYYQASDVLLHAAHGENLPLVVIEASACGTPVVATAVGGIPELVQEGNTGFLVAPGDSAAMARQIVELVRRPDLARRMGQAAAIHAKHSFGLDQQVSAYLSWFEELKAEYTRDVWTSLTQSA